jgi:hypothetical protein
MSVAVRVPEETHDSSKAMGALRGRTTGAMLALAWEEYLANHQDEFSSDLQRAAELVQAGDFEGLAVHASRDAGDRAAQAAARLRK